VHPWYKDVFIANNITLTRGMTALPKWMLIRSATDSSMLMVVGNFDVTQQTVTVNFPTAGTWYDYLQGNTFTAVGGSQIITLQPGEFHVYLNRNLTNAVLTPVGNVNNPGNKLSASIFPNPASGNSNSVLELDIPVTGHAQVEIFNATGQKISTLFAGVLTRGVQRIPLTDKINNLPAGTYLLQIHTNKQRVPVKLILQ
jgi:hypothetical protein